MDKKTFEKWALAAQSLASGAAIAAALASVAGMASLPPVVPLLGAVLALAVTIASGALSPDRMDKAGRGGQ